MRSVPTVRRHIIKIDISSGDFWRRRKNLFATRPSLEGKMSQSTTPDLN
jgi:hypothetical protein